MRILLRIVTLLTLCAALLGACVIGGNVTPKCQDDADCPAGQFCQSTICLKRITETIVTPQEPISTDRANDAGPRDDGANDAAPDTTNDEPPNDTSETCIDEDKDGYCKNIPGDKGELDCDDKDKQSYPGNKEICDGKDNDCNGTPDDNLGQAPLCPKQKGICKGARHQTCDGTNGWKPCEQGAYKAFNGNYEATEESCDGKDNDCDGRTDESFADKGNPCLAKGKRGECARGTFTACSNGVPICTATTTPKTEICDNGKDDDCDGRTDESPPCTCKAGTVEACYNQPIGCTRTGSKYNCKGLCQTGTRTCKADSTWGTCQGAKGPVAEICDGKDNDCDGNVDETYAERGKTCKDAQQKGKCADGTYTACNSGKLVCTTTTKPTREICGNSIDDDCDGATDETDCRLNYATTSSIQDYAVRSSGKALVAHSLSTLSSFKLTCLGVDGKVVKSLTINKTGSRIEYPSITAAPGTKDVNVLTWIERTSLSSSSRQLYAQLYDSNCKALTSARITIPKSAGRDYTHDVAVAASGDFVVAYRDNGEQPHIQFYNSTGTAIGGEIAVDPDKKFCNTTYYGIQVATNANGDGVVSCQKSGSSPIAYRRFNANRQLAGTKMNTVAASENGNSSNNRTHATNINAQGTIAIQWVDLKTYKDRAVLISATNKITQFDIGNNVGSGYDGFGFQGQRIERFNNDFIFRDSNNSGTTSLTRRWYRYDMTGKLMSVAESNLRPQLLRMTGTTNFMSDSVRIIRNALDFGTGNGVCNNRACVCKPNETRACFNGGSSARAPCKNGTQTCSSDGLSWGPCAGEILPSPEQCGNNKDDDCDGSTDENCPTSHIQPIGVNDYAAADDGSIVSVHWNGKILYGSCWGPNGNVTKGFFPISQAGRYVREPSVRMAPGNKHIIVSWWDSPSTQSSAGTWTSMLFNSSCTSISQPIKWGLPTTRARYDFAIDESGRFVVAYRSINDGVPQLNFYNANGVPVKTGVKLVGTQCGNSSSSFHVVLHPTNGTGVFSCSQITRGPVYFRLFNTSGTAIGPNPITVKNSDSNRGSYYQTHIIGINGKGEIAIQWQDRTNDRFHATIYDSNGKVSAELLNLSSRMSNNRDAFAFVHQKVEVIGDDFIFRDGGLSNTTPNWYRYNATGKAIAAHLGSSSLGRSTLRIAGTDTYILKQGQIVKNEVKLNPGSGLCGTQFCVCIPNSKRNCYSGGTGTPRTPCKAGTQTCASDGLGWGPCSGQVLPQPETCGDMIDNDCDGAVDDNCPRTNTMDVGAQLTDYDVASDNSIVAIQWTGTGLLAHCINANLTVRKGGILVTPFGEYVRDARVKVAKTSKHFLVVWRNLPSSNSSNGILTARLYNSTCAPVGKAFVIDPNPTPHDFFDFAIDDSGGSVFIWKNGNYTKSLMTRYDNKGVRQGTPVEFDPGNSRCRGSYGMKLAINPANRAGVITCEQFYNVPIYFRTFNSAGTLAGTAMIAAANTANANGFNRAHNVGVNRRGDWVLFWYNNRSRKFMANFYSAPQTLVKHISSVSTNSSSSIDQFRINREGIELFGNNFLLRDGGSSGSTFNWLRYSPTGTASGSVRVTSSTYLEESLRSSGTKLFIIRSNRIEVGTLKLP